MAEAITWIHGVATFLMTGIIWFVQIVHYPLFRMVSQSSFSHFEAAHMSRTSWLVAPLMLIEFTSAVILIFIRTVDAFLVFNIALLVAIWLSTAMLQVPLHRQLARSFDSVKHYKLVRGNWIRTTLWTIRSCLMPLIIGS